MTSFLSVGDMYGIDPNSVYWNNIFKMANLFYQFVQLLFGSKSFCY